jgi:hypothetical protein
MATTTYAIYAFSPTLNQRVRQFNLAQINVPQLDATAAQKDADIFAHIQNQNEYLGATNWQGQIVLEQHGIDTLDNFISAS